MSYINFQSGSGGSGSSTIFTIIGIIILGIIGYWIYKTVVKGKIAPAAAAPPPAATAANIYPDANPPQECHDTIEGELEQDGDRKEPQIACGFDFLNTEATVYVKATGINDTLSVKLRGPKHSGISDDDMCNSIHYINLGSESKAAFGKQSGHTAEYCEFGDAIPAIPDGVWVGVKAVEYNEGSSVKFETYLDNPEGSGWQKVAEFLDDGPSTGCGGDDPRAGQPYTTSPCQDVGHPVSIGFRVDGLSGGGDVEFKGISVREITPPAGAPVTAVLARRRTRTSTIDNNIIIKLGNL